MYQRLQETLKKRNSPEFQSGTKSLKSAGRKSERMKGKIIVHLDEKSSVLEMHF